MEGVAPTITRLHKGDAEIEKKESFCAEEGHSTPRSPLLECITEPSRSMDAMYKLVFANCDIHFLPMALLLIFLGLTEID